MLFDVGDVVITSLFCSMCYVVLQIGPYYHLFVGCFL